MEKNDGAFLEESPSNGSKSNQVATTYASDGHTVEVAVDETQIPVSLLNVQREFKWLEQSGLARGQSCQWVCGCHFCVP
jgi:hypothetical protein